MSDHAYQRWKCGDPVLMHGARVYSDTTHGPEGVHRSTSCVVLPLDERRARPSGRWIRFEETGVLCGLVTSRRGHECSLTGCTLDELVQATVAAID